MWLPYCNDVLGMREPTTKYAKDALWPVVQKFLFLARCLRGMFNHALDSAAAATATANTKRTSPPAPPAPPPVLGLVLLLLFVFLLLPSLLLLLLLCLCFCYYSTDFNCSASGTGNHHGYYYDASENLGALLSSASSSSFSSLRFSPSASVRKLLPGFGQSLADQGRPELQFGEAQ